MRIWNKGRGEKENTIKRKQNKSNDRKTKTIKPKAEYTVTMIYGKIFLLLLTVMVIRKNISLLPLL